MSELLMVSKAMSVINVYCDNTATIQKLKSAKYNCKTRRHIHIRLKSVRDLVSRKVIVVDYVGTKDNTIDPLTKGLELALVLKSRLGMGLNPI